MLMKGYACWGIINGNQSYITHIDKVVVSDVSKKIYITEYCIVKFKY